MIFAFPHVAGVAAQRRIDQRRCDISEDAPEAVIDDVNGDDPNGAAWTPDSTTTNTWLIENHKLPAYIRLQGKRTQCIYYSQILLRSRAESQANT